MAIGLIGRKAGMTRVFTEEGVSVPVTVIEVTPNRVAQVKSDETDGYKAVQVTVGERRLSRVSKPVQGHVNKNNVQVGRGFWEMRVEGDDLPEIGSELTVESFEAGQKVDVTGQSKGKGFQGGVKRWNFSMQDATHGNSLSTVRRVRLVSAKRRVVSSRVRKWPVTWVLSALLFRAWRSCVLTQSVTCCWSRALCPVLTTATLSSSHR